MIDTVVEPDTRDTELDRTVAVKIPRQEQLSRDDVEMFLREARAAAQLHHPNIVSVHEVGRDGDTVFIVSDLNPRALSPKLLGFVQARSWFQDITPVAVGN